MSWNHAIVRIVPGQRRRRLAPALASLVAWLALASAAHAQPWWDANWNERKKLTFNNADQTENLDDFPVLVVLDSTRIDYTKTQNNGEDLRFIDADGITVLSHEIEKWDETGTSYVWVKVPQIVGASTTDHVWMYYDNILALDAQDSAGVWSNGYAGVWHLKESGNGTADEFADSTINANHGQGVGGSGLGSRKCELVIQASKVPASLTDFPVLLSEATLPSEMLDADGANPALNGGGDIRFSSDASGSTRLSCEIVNFTTDNNPANGKAEIWVKVPSVSSSSNTSIWVWYGTSGASQPAASAAYGSESVWDSNYKMVQHMNEDPSGAAPQVIDATSNDNDGTSAGSMTSGDLVDARIGKGLDFDGVNDKVDVASSNSLDILTKGTMEFWMYPKEDAGAGPSYSIVLGRWGGNSGGHWVFFAIRSNSNYHFEVSDGSTKAFISTNNSLPKLNWYHVVLTWDVDATNDMKAYVNGVLDKEGNSGFTAMGDAVRSLRIAEPSNDFYGNLDEVRISDTARSATWITAEYNNQNNPSTFVIEGTPEAGPTVGPTQVTGKIGNAQNFDGTDDRVDVSKVVNDVNTTQGTLSVWMNMQGGIESDGVANATLGVGFAANNDNLISLDKTSTDKFQIRYRVADVQYKALIGAAQVSTFGGAWKHVVGVWDSGNLYIYEGGSLVQGPITRGADINIANLDQGFLGVDSQVAQNVFFTGYNDEVRISSVARSADWIAAQYKSMTDTFIRLSSKIISWREVEP